MASLNKVMLIGNLTRDPEKRFTPSGMAVSDVNLAMNRRYKASNGEWKEEACFVTVELWGKTAENVVEYKRKGDPLFVEGRLKLDQWEKDGQKHSRLKVVADNIQFLPRGTGPQDGGQRRGPVYGDAPPDQEGGPADGPADEPPARGGGYGGGAAGGDTPDNLPF